MSGPFYGSLAASASVFVAILTALLVNNYVQIKSDRRQVRNELDRIEEELDGLRERRGDFRDAVDTLVERREADYREKAEERVSEFLETEVPSEFVKPIEKLDLEDLYQALLDYHEYESADELEESPINLHHREILEEQLDEIKNEVLQKVVPSFASKYEGEGWDPDTDPNHSSLAEKLKKKSDEKGGEDEAKSGEGDEPDNVIEVGELERDPLDSDEFIERYKEEHDLDSLDDRTIDALETHYEEVVDTYPYEHESVSSGPGGTPGTGPLGSPQLDMLELITATNRVRESGELTERMDFPAQRSVLGLNIQERQKLEEAREDLRDAENEIQILENRQAQLEREKERLHPEDLVPTLTANVATITLSVVIPIFAYLLSTTNTTIIVPSWAWIISHTEVNVFLSWLLGLGVVFESIHARMNDRDPQAYSFYKRVRNHVSRG